MRAGILDADITGPSIPRMFGLQGGRDKRDRTPAESTPGVKIVSLNLLLSEEDNPVIWRGPLIHQCHKTILDTNGMGRAGLPRQETGRVL
ncbi:MAG: P-loop NTPase [Bacillota bacterium]